LNQIIEESRDEHHSNSILKLAWLAILDKSPFKISLQQLQSLRIQNLKDSGSTIVIQHKSAAFQIFIRLRSPSYHRYITGQIGTLGPPVIKLCGSWIGY